MSIQRVFAFFLYPGGTIFLFPEIILEHLSNLEYYKSIFPTAEVQRGAMFSVSWGVVCLGKYTV